MQGNGDRRDVSAIVIEPLDPGRHDRSGFSCGTDRLDNFLRFSARAIDSGDGVRDARYPGAGRQRRIASPAVQPSGSNSRRKAASPSCNPVSVKTTDFALLTGSEINPFS